MKKITVAFCLRDWDWGELQERDKLAREEECVNCGEGITSEDMQEGK